MLKVANVTWSLTDDIIFNNPALVLFANTCKWACPGCHNKALQCFESTNDLLFSDTHAVMSYVFNCVTKYKFMNELTVVGSGGDFFFQLNAWLDFADRLDYIFPAAKLIWYTGAEYSEENLDKLLNKKHLFDAILWGKLRHREGMVVKTLTLGSDLHTTPGEILTGEYNYKFEENV